MLPSAALPRKPIVDHGAAIADFKPKIEAVKPVGGFELIEAAHARADGNVSLRIDRGQLVANRPGSPGFT